MLKIFAKHLTIRHLLPGQHLLTPNTKDDNMYKVVKGEAGLRRAREGVWATRGKGELIEGLDILSLSAIEIVATNEAGEEAFARSTYLAALTGVAALLPSLPDKVWVGVSAGSMVMTPRIGDTSEKSRPMARVT